MMNFNEKLRAFGYAMEKIARFFYMQPKWFRYQIIRSKETYLPVFFKHRNRKHFFLILLDLMYLAIKWHCLPFHYFRYGLYDKSFSRKRMLNYLPETVLYYRLLPRLNRNMFLLDDKNVFASIIKAHNIPHPKTILSVKHDTILDVEGNILNPVQTSELIASIQADLILKPATGSGGKDIIVFKRVESGDFIYCKSKLNHEFLSNLSKGDWILQTYIKQDNAISCIHPSSINTLRVMTVFHEKLGAKVIFCMLKAGANRAVTDNAHTGGVYVRVDIISGQLDETAYDENLQRHLSHPTTGVIFKGKCIRQIREITTLAERCANIFPDVKLAGWDIACAEQGPLVIEGNSSPGLTIIQRTHDGMVNVLMSHLSNIPKES